MKKSLNYQELLLQSFDKVVESSVPQNCLPAYLPSPPTGHTYIVGAGKAAAKMAEVFEEHYQGSYSGTVITRYGFVAKTKTIKVVEASHPTPDQAGRDAAKEILEIAEKATKDDLVICLLSGGGSSLLSCPPDEVDFSELQSLNDQLLKCGASISEINTVRKHLNRAFGGKLAQKASPAKVVTLSISDVAGDDPSTIASGPTVADPTTQEEAKQIIRKYKLRAGSSVISYLKNPENETLKADDVAFENSEYILIATPEKSLGEAEKFFKSKGITPYILSSELEGDTNECAFFHMALAKRVLEKNRPFKKPCVLISGGETTVKVEGDGQGGPNTQFMLKLAIEARGVDDMYALACDTDGIDGCMDNAGAVITPDTLKRAESQKISPQDYIENNDSYRFFEAIDDLIISGPTHTNVNDYRAILLV